MICGMSRAKTGQKAGLRLKHGLAFHNVSVSYLRSGDKLVFRMYRTLGSSFTISNSRVLDVAALIPLIFYDNRLTIGPGAGRELGCSEFGRHSCDPVRGCARRTFNQCCASEEKEIDHAHH